MSRSVAFEGDIEPILADVIRGKYGPKPQIIIETGPYLGRGSSLQLIMANPVDDPVRHIALEAVWEFVEEAKKTFDKYFWAEVIHALPTGLREAREFVVNDHWVLDNPSIPHDYPDPTAGYTWELSDEHLGIPDHNPEEYWFAKNLPKYRGLMPFFFLDSGGGTGYLEFNTMRALMHDAPYYVFLDDCDHVKHWRSYNYLILNDYEILAKQDEIMPRWVLARKI